MLLSQYSHFENTLDAEEESSKGYTSDKATTDSSTLQGGMLVEKCQSFCRPDISKEKLTKCLERMKI